MKTKSFLGLFCLSCATLLVGCNATSNTVGETIKGERVSILEPVHAIEADAQLEGVQPTLAREIVNLSWNQTGYDSQHALPNVQAPSYPRVVWEADIGTGSSSRYKLLSQPVGGRGLIYTMDAEGLVRAFDAKTGAVVWEKETAPADADSAAIAGGLALDGGIVFATTGFGDVLALDAKTGVLKWRRSLMNPLRAAPTIANERVYVLSIDNQLSVLSAASGAFLWKQAGIAESATLMGASSPAVHGDTVVVAYSSGELVGLRAQNGRGMWNFSLASSTQVGALPAIADIRGLPVIDRGRIYAISHSGRMAAIEERSGGRVWETDVGGINTPVVSGDAIFVFGGDSQLMALTRDSGRVLWTVSLPKYEDEGDRDSDALVWSGPLLAGERLWMVNSKGVMASFMIEDGLSVHSIDVGEPLYLVPIVVDQAYYVVTDSGTLVCLR